MTWLEWLTDIWNIMVEETHKREIMMYDEEIRNRH